MTSFHDDHTVLMPYNEETEQALLGALLHNNESLERFQNFKDLNIFPCSQWAHL